MSKSLSLVFSFLMIASLAQSQTLNIIPAPVKAEAKQGTFLITPKTSIVVTSAAADKSAAFFNDYLEKFYGFKLNVSKKENNRCN